MAPPLPWRSSAGIDTDQTYVVVTSRLPLRSHRHIPAVLRTTLSLVRELQRSDGLVGYALRAEIARKTFWTMSAWKTHGDLEQFVHSPAHLRAMAEMSPHIDQARIETTVVAGATIPPTWEDLRRALTHSSRPPTA